MRRNVHFSDEKIDQIKKKFQYLDITGTGKLSRETTAQILMEEGAQLDRLMIALLFEKYDADGDEMIDLNEFVCFCKEMEQLQDIDILRQIFDLADVDKNQYLDLSEVKRIGQLMGLDVTEDDSMATIMALDENNDNLIDFDEFCKILSF
ncbi:EF hand family protein [Histomonas meleagridis]|uniref:EF hand family protein n=1 Tax=Histomonas meleagridis TaxID=135588 RepID=UPI00355950B5|nr:EF hand family protein [Histomonas meleagridis]KAH0805622.1 EF hand family protein [Histomonas meleagridis]